MSAGAAPVSVVIPIHNDEQALERCLHSLYDFSTVPLDVVVVDDGSDTDPSAVTKKFPCRLIRLRENHGPAYARNRGVEACRGDVVLFTDADCRVAKDWAKKFSERFRELRALYPRLAAVAGRLDSDKGCVAMAFAYTSYAYAQSGPPRFYNYLNTANAAVSKAAFLKAGGFSEDMRVNEDPDLAMKLVEAGYRVYFEPSIHVYHDHGITRLDDFLAKELRWGRLSSSKLDLKHARFGRFSFLLRNPVTHFLLVLPLAFAASAASAVYSKRNGRKVLRYFPLIFLGKLFHRWGSFIGEKRQ